MSFTIDNKPKKSPEEESGIDDRLEIDESQETHEHESEWLAHYKEPNAFQLLMGMLIPNTANEENNTAATVDEKGEIKPDKLRNLIGRNRNMLAYLFTLSLVLGSAFAPLILRTIDYLRHIPPPTEHKYWAAMRRYAKLKNERKGEKKIYIDELQKRGGVKNINEEISLFAHQDYFNGLIKREEIEICIWEYRKRIYKHRRYAKILDTKENIHRMIRTQGRYVPYMHGTCHPVLYNQSQCNSRARNMYLTVKGTYGNKIPLKWIHSGRHLEIGLNLNGIWYLSQKPTLNPMHSKDFKRISTIEPDAATKAFLGKPVKETFIQEDGTKVTKVRQHKKGNDFTNKSFFERVNHNIVPGNFGTPGFEESTTDEKMSYKEAQKRIQEGLKRVVKMENDDARKKGYLIMERIVKKNEITTEMLEEARRTGKIDLSYSTIKNVDRLRGVENLKVVNLYNSAVVNIDGLRGKPIEFINIKGTKIKDLDPLGAAPLKTMITNDVARDYSFLKAHYGELPKIFSIPKGYFLDEETHQLVNIESLKPLDPIDAGTAKRGTDRECLSFREKPSYKKIKICLDDQEESDPNMIIDDIKLYYQLQKGKKKASWMVKTGFRFTYNSRSAAIRTEVTGPVKWSKKSTPKVRGIKGVGNVDVKKNLNKSKNPVGITQKMLDEAEKSGFLFLKDKKITHLDFLKGRSIRTLDLRNTNAEDITPLHGMPLNAIFLGGTPIKNITALQNSPIKIIQVNEHIKDLSVLKKNNFPIHVFGIPKGYRFNPSNYLIEPGKANNSHEHYNRYLKALGKLQNIKEEQEGEAKEGTDRECLTFESVRLKKLTACINEEMFREKVKSIILGKSKMGTYFIHIKKERKGGNKIIYAPVGAVKWSKKPSGLKFVPYKGSKLKRLNRDSDRTQYKAFYKQCLKRRSHRKCIYQVIQLFGREGLSAILEKEKKKIK